MGNWTCPLCRTVNEANAVSCLACGAGRGQNLQTGGGVAAVPVVTAVGAGSAPTPPGPAPAPPGDRRGMVIVALVAVVAALAAGLVVALLMGGSDPATEVSSEEPSITTAAPEVVTTVAPPTTAAPAAPTTAPVTVPPTIPLITTPLPATPPPSNSNVMPTGSWVAVIESIPYSEGLGEAQRRQAGIGGGSFVIDTAYHPGMTRNYYAVVLGPFASEAQATAHCGDVGRSPGGSCYGRNVTYDAG